MSDLDFCLALCRFGHFAALMPLTGGALLMPALTSTDPPFRWPRIGAWLAIATAVTALLWLMLLAASFTGDLHAMVSRHTLSLVLDQTAFGQVWRLRLILAAAMLAAFALSWSRRHVMPALAMLLLASLGFTGHAADGGLGMELAQALHLLAGGLWLGGLAVLLRLALVADAEAASALRRFSRLGPWLVAVIALSGFINAASLLRGPGDLLLPGYGQTLSVKLLLVAGMLVCAANNRFRLAPKLGAALEPTRRALVCSLAVELALGLGVLAATSLLGMLGPPGD